MQPTHDGQWRPPISAMAAPWRATGQQPACCDGLQCLRLIDASHLAQRRLPQSEVARHQAAVIALQQRDAHMIDGREVQQLLAGVLMTAAGRPAWPACRCWDCSRLLAGRFS